ncbi:MAG: hypothetical protein KDB69_04660 [Acidimicrobiia bacterium]|nr:hypothetical protein [Acidimicrobiia bacterium]
MRKKVLTTRQPLLKGQMRRLLEIDTVDQESVVTRRGGTFCVLEMVDGELSVMLGDRELRMPARVKPAVAHLASGRKVPVAEVPGLDESGRLVLVRRLIQEGLLEVVS